MTEAIDTNCAATTQLLHLEVDVSSIQLFPNPIPDLFSIRGNLGLY